MEYNRGMAKKLGNVNNLIPQNRRTKEKQREIARKGGKRSGEVRREKKRLSTIYSEMLASKYEVEIDDEKKVFEGLDFIRFIAKDILLRKDSASVSLLKEIREATEGSKVTLDGITVLIDKDEADL